MYSRLFVAMNSYELDRQHMCATYTLESNAFPDVGKIVYRKPITLPLTHNRELTAADVQYTRPIPNRKILFVRKKNR